MTTAKPRTTTDVPQPPPIHSPWLTLAYSLGVGLVGLGILGYRLAASQQPLAWPPILLLAFLSLLIQRSSFHLGSPVVHSLAGVIDLAAVLALGPVGGGLVAVVSGLTYLELNALRHQRQDRRSWLEIPVLNAGLKALMALAGGWVFQALDGLLPLGSGTHPDEQVVVALGVVCLLWFALDHLGWGIWDYLEGGSGGVRAFDRKALSLAVVIELLPLPLSLVVALVFVQLPWYAFGLLSLAIVAVAVLAQRWADTRAELTQRVAELTTIEQVGRAIAEAQLDVDGLCRLMYDHARQIMDTTIFHLGLFDGDDYVIKLWIREGQEEPPRTFRMEPGVGLVNWLRSSQQPLLVHDFERELDSLPARPAYVSERPPHSALFVPLVADSAEGQDGRHVTGTLSIQSFRRNAYGQSDLRVLSAMANQAAVAIQKAQLYSQERWRARQLETIGQVGRQVTATLELEELFLQTVHLIRENFGYYHVAIYTADPERQAVQFEASASAGQQDVTFEVEWDQGLIGWVAAHAESVTVNDVENDTRYRCVEALEETQAELAVPLVVDDGVVGVLDVQSDEPGAFGDDDLFILETLGDQIAIAIQEARLYDAERQQAWLSTALLQVAESMSYLSDIDAVLTTLVRLTALLAGVDRCIILLWDPDLEAFTPGQIHGLNPDLREEFEDRWFSPDEFPALEQIREDKVPLVVSVGDDEHLIPGDLAETFDIQEMALLPLLAQGELLGAMMVDYAGQRHHFSERIVEMLTGIANQAAMVIHSARLIQAQREEAYVSMALVQVAEAVSRSIDLDEAMQTVVRITPLLAGVEACTVFLWTGSGGGFVPYKQYGLEEAAEDTFYNLFFPAEHPVSQALFSGSPLVSLDEVPECREVAKVLGEGSVLVISLASKGEILGLMTVDYVGPAHRINQRWLEILTGIAGQAAIAIENDRLLREAAEQERLKQELDVARRIQASFLPERCPNVPGWELAAVWRSAREVGGDFYDFFPLPPSNAEPGAGGERLGVVIADVADKGVPAALFMALSRTLMRTMAIDGRPPSQAIARANDLILADARSGMFVTLFYVILSPESGHIQFVNAGHMPVLLVRAADDSTEFAEVGSTEFAEVGSTELAEVGSTEELRTHGMALGVVAGQDFEEGAAHLAPGDALLLYTDGVVEASNAEGEMFGRERLVALAQAVRHQPAEALARSIDEAITAFVGDAAQFDDFTLVVARRSPTHPPAGSEPAGG
jgi:serine phosphatase RsbU (regulator of sigma subunit)/putative methionine-R-sulfoxide reductase with GAF domain